MRDVLVSVLMTVYNGAPFVGEAVRSILEQRFQEFEFLIIDNASTDSSWEIIASFKDPRIRVVKNAENLGPPRALNQGLQLVQGKYVARMDADDVALPDRLARQVRFLEDDPECVALGTQIRMIHHAGRSLYAPLLPTARHDMLSKLMLSSPLSHSSVMLRRDVVLGVGGYDEKLRHAADYQLWSSLVSRGHQIANLDEQHMLIRVHSMADGLPANRKELIEEVSLVSHRNIQEFLGLAVTREEVTKMIRLLDWYDRCPREDVPGAIRLLDSITKACENKAAPFYGRTLLRLAISAREIHLLGRLSLFLKGVWLIVSEKDGQFGYRFLREWILTGRFIGAVLYGLRRLPRVRGGAA